MPIKIPERRVEYESDTFNIWLFESEKSNIKMITLDPAFKDIFEDFECRIPREKLNLSDNAKPTYFFKYRQDYLDTVLKDGQYVVKYLDFVELVVKTHTDPPTYIFSEAVVTKTFYEDTREYLDGPGANRISSDSYRKCFVTGDWYSEGYIDYTTVGLNDFADTGVEYKGWRVMDAYHDTKRVIQTPAYEVHLSY